MSSAEAGTKALNASSIGRYPEERRDHLVVYNVLNKNRLRLLETMTVSQNRLGLRSTFGLDDPYNHGHLKFHPSPSNSLKMAAKNPFLHGAYVSSM